MLTCSMPCPPLTWPPNPRYFTRDWPTRARRTLGAVPKGCLCYLPKPTRDCPTQARRLCYLPRTREKPVWKPSEPAPNPPQTVRTGPNWTAYLTRSLPQHARAALVMRTTIISGAALHPTPRQRPAPAAFCLSCLSSIVSATAASCCQLPVGLLACWPRNRSSAFGLRSSIFGLRPSVFGPALANRTVIVYNIPCPAWRRSRR